MLIGFQIAGLVTDMHTAAGLHDWPRIWLFPAVIAALISVLFLFSFRNVVVAYERPGV